MTRIRRRELLRSGATLAALGGMVGVSAARRRSGSTAADVRSAGRQVPAWADWVPDPATTPNPETNRLVYQYDMAALVRATDVRTQIKENDPMVNPLVAGFAGAFITLGLQQTGIAKPIVGPLVTQDDPDPDAVPADAGVLLQGGGQVYLGTFSAAALQDAVAAGSFSETATAGVYAHNEQDQVLTWGDGYVVVGKTEGQVNAVVAAGTGEATRLYEKSADYRWLLENGGGGEFTIAVYDGDEPLSDLSTEDSTLRMTMFEGARGFAQSATVDDQGTFADATTAVVYPSSDDVDMEGLRSSLGGTADDVAANRNGRYVTVRAAYDGGQVSGGGGGTPAGTDTQTGDGGGGDGGDGGGDGGDGTASGTGGGGDGDDGGGGQNDDDGTSSSAPGMGVVGALAGLLGGGYLLAKDRTEE